MDSLLKASENFEQVSDEFDEKLFVEFMKKITIWDFFGISKEQYLAIPEQEKRVKISQYYSDMKSKSTGELFFFFCLIWCLRCLRWLQFLMFTFCFTFKY